MGAMDRAASAPPGGEKAVEGAGGRMTGRVGEESSRLLEDFYPDGGKGKGRIFPRSGPLWMAAFYVALFIIRPWEQLMPWLADWHFERTYAILMIIAVLSSKKVQHRFGTQSFFVILFLLCIGLSGLLAVMPFLSWPPFYSYMTIVIFYFIMLMVVRSPYDLFFMVAAYIATMFIYLAKAQWEFWIWGQHRYDQGVVRLSGIELTFGGPNDLAMSIVASLPFLLALWNNRRELSANWPEKWQKWFTRSLQFYFVLAVSSIILTNSRSGMLAFILFTFMVVSRGRGMRKKVGYVIAGILLLGIIWLVMPEENRARFMTIWKPEEGPANAQVSAQGRIEGLKIGLQMFSQRPLSGVGLGNFIGYRLHRLDGIALNAHNLVGQMLGETGLLGTVSFCLVVVAVLINCRRTRLKLGGLLEFPVPKMLFSLAYAIRDSLILLTFEGLFSHNLFRFNWLWLAAFSLLAWTFAEQISRRAGRRPATAGINGVRP